MSLETLRQVRRENEAARERDREREQALADSNPNGESPTREGIPLDMWRGARP